MVQSGLLSAKLHNTIQYTCQNLKSHLPNPRDYLLNSVSAKQMVNRQNFPSGQWLPLTLIVFGSSLPHLVSITFFYCLCWFSNIPVNDG